MVPFSFVWCIKLERLSGQQGLHILVLYLVDKMLQGMFGTEGDTLLVFFLELPFFTVGRNGLLCSPSWVLNELEVFSLPIIRLFGRRLSPNLSANNPVFDLPIVK